MKALRLGSVRLLALFMCAMLLLTVQPVNALERATAEDVVHGIVRDSGAAFAGASLSTEVKRVKIAALVEKFSDITYISELLLGRHWRKASPAQQQTFTDLLVPFFVATYGEMIDAVKVRPDVVFVGVEPRGDSIIVYTQLVTPGEEPVGIDWLIGASPTGKVGVLDVVADNISMVTTIRSDFTAVIRSGGGNMEALFDAMRKKIALADAAPR